MTYIYFDRPWMKLFKSTTVSHKAYLALSLLQTLARSSSGLVLLAQTVGSSTSIFPPMALKLEVPLAEKRKQVVDVRVEVIVGSNTADEAHGKIKFRLYMLYAHSFIAPSTTLEHFL